MKKIFLVALVIALSSVLLLFAGCRQSEYETIKGAFERIEDAVSAEKLVEVTNSGTLLSSEEESYSKSDAGFQVTTTIVTLNPIGNSDEMYDRTVIGPEGCSGISVGEFPSELMLEDVVYSGERKDLSLNAVLSSEYLVSLGFEAEDCQGGAKFTASLSEGDFAEMQISYISSNGNNVLILFVFEY